MLKAVTIWFWRTWSPFKATQVATALDGIVWILVVSMFAVALVSGGVALQEQETRLMPFVAASLSALGSGLFGTVATVTALEVLRDARAAAAVRQEVLSRLRSKDQAAVRAELEILRADGRLKSGFLDGANLKYAVWTNCDLSCLRAVGADLSGADFRGANLYSADLRGANLDDISINDQTNLLTLRAALASTAGAAHAALEPWRRR